MGFFVSVGALRKKNPMIGAVTVTDPTSQAGEQPDMHQALDSAVAGSRASLRFVAGGSVQQSSFVLPVHVCVSPSPQGAGVLCVCWGGGPEAPSTSHSDFGLRPRCSASVARQPCVSGVRDAGACDAAHQDLSWGSPGGVRLTTRVNSRNAVRWPASSWRSSLVAPARRNRASARNSRSSLTRGGAR
jgi:hypothetical protein